MKIIKKPSKASEPTYYSKGFALIYEDSIFKSQIVHKKLNNDQNYVLHSFLNDNTVVTISTPYNKKSLKAKVRKTFKYPPIYNIVITKKMAENLELDINNPYVEVLAIKKNDKFIAKKASIFEVLIPYPNTINGCINSLLNQFFIFPIITYFNSLFYLHSKFFLQ